MPVLSSCKACKQLLVACSCCLKWKEVAGAKEWRIIGNALSVDLVCMHSGTGDLQCPAPSRQLDQMHLEKLNFRRKAGLPLHAWLTKWFCRMREVNAVRQQD